MRWYEDETQFDYAGPLPPSWYPTDKLALVHVAGDGLTTKGWGRTSFMENYQRGKFAPKGYLRRYEHGRAFGIVMRSVPMFCIDIDGKNGGYQSAKILELPVTLGETSKSGKGIHLFYQEPNAVWDEKYGYESLPDANGLLPGIDIRAYGIVFHHPQQRWNRQAVAAPPSGIIKLLLKRKQSVEATKERTKASKLLDPEERAIMADELLQELQQPIPEGRRNTRLYAWGCQADGLVKDWPLHLHYRGEQAGLESSELIQIIQSVRKYGSSE